MRILTVYEDVSAARTYKIKVSEDTGEIERELDVSAETPRAENGKLICDAKIENSVYVSQNYNVVDHGVIYMPTNSLNGRELTEYPRHLQQHPR